MTPSDPTSSSHTSLPWVVGFGSTATIGLWSLLLVRQAVGVWRVFRAAADAPLPNMGPAPTEFAFRLVWRDTLVLSTLAVVSVGLAVLVWRTPSRWRASGLVAAAAGALWYFGWPLGSFLRPPTDSFFVALHAGLLCLLVLWVYVSVRLPHTYLVHRA